MINKLVDELKHDICEDEGKQTDYWLHIPFSNIISGICLPFEHDVQSNTQSVGNCLFSTKYVDDDVTPNT